MQTKKCAYLRQYHNNSNISNSSGFCTLFNEQCIENCYAYTPIKELDDRQLVEIKTTLQNIKEKLNKLEYFLNQYHK